MSLAVLDWRRRVAALLGVAVPDAPFPHVNTTDDFRSMVGLDAE